MSNFAFDIRTSKDLLEKLRAEVVDFRKDWTSSRIAINLVMTAWHLTEWVYHEYLKEYHKTEKECQAYFKQLCPSLEIMESIANGSKHYSLTRGEPGVKGTSLHKGAFSNGFSRGYDISTLDVEMRDGRRVFFEDEVEHVADFWVKYFRVELHEDVSNI